MPPVESVPVRVLLVEDEAIIARDIERRLCRLGYVVVGIADTGAEALATAREMRPAIVIMDIVLQGPMDGVDTAAALVREMDVPVVFLTAHTDAVTINRAKTVAPYGYLVKPFEERELQTTIEMALHRHEREAEARLLHHAFASATTGIAVIDAQHPKRAITLCNAAFERMTGYTAREIVGSSAGFLLGLGTDPAASKELRRALEEQRECQQTVMLHRKDGTQFWSDISISPVRDTASRVSHLLCSHTDVTARKHSEVALHKAQKMESIGQLAGGIAHDFNNILSAIISFAGFVRDDLSAGDPRRDDIAEVLRAADRAAALTRQLLTFSRQHPTAKHPIDLNSSIANLIKMLRRSVGEDIQVEGVPSARPAVVYMDSIQVDQVLLNLAVNARDAMPEGGLLCFTLSHPDSTVGDLPVGKCVRITASDTGSGMDDSTISRIFEPFFTTKPEGKGTGLGLATCYAIVHDAGGTIRVDSSPGKGTTFTIDLPVCEEPVADSLERVPTIGRGSGERILVVEDDPAVREAAVRALTYAGYDVSQAQDGDEAISLVKETRPEFDLVISDVVMPRRDGYAVLAHVRKHAPKTRVILTSGYLDGRASGDASGAEPVLWKPFTSADLVRAARAALNPSRSDAS